MARNPAKQFNLGIHKIPSFRFHFYKKHTIPPKTRGFNPRCSRRFLSMAWPSSCFRQTSRWSLAMSKANRQDPQEVKLNHADLPPRKTKWWRDKGGILKRYGKAKVFAQREGRSCWKKMRDEFGGRIWFVFWRLNQTPLFSWCKQIFSQLKNSGLTILRKNIIKEFQTISYHISLQCLKFGFSLPWWTTPNNNPQKSSCVLLGSDTNQPPSVFRWISLAFREFFGFNAFRHENVKTNGAPQA